MATETEERTQSHTVTKKKKVVTKRKRCNLRLITESICSAARQRSYIPHNAEI